MPKVARSNSVGDVYLGPKSPARVEGQSPASRVLAVHNFGRWEGGGPALIEDPKSPASAEKGTAVMSLNALF